MFGLEQLLVGQTLGRWYRVDDVLGGGGFGVVFRATDLRPERAAKTVAVKVLSLPGGLDEEGRRRMRERFRHEAAFAAALPHHPNVVPIFDYGSDLGLDYLVMELLRGEDLRRRLARPEALPLPEALRIVRDAARGVAVGHQAGLIHRDVKPGNLFLSEGGDAGPTVRVLDFGIAKRVEAADDATATHLTRHGEGFFSGRYASPEQLRREAGLTRASDVFSLGVVAFELLSRSRLFEGADQARRESGLAVPVPSLGARNPQVPAGVEAVVTRALAHDPADRFRDAAAFEAALRAACRDAGLRLDAPHRPTVVEAPSPVGARTDAADAGDGTTFAAPEPAGPVTSTAEDAGTVVAPSADHGHRERRGTGFDDARATPPTDGESGTDADPPAADDRRTPWQRRRRWRRPHQISRRRGIAVAAVVAFLLGSAVVMSAAAVGSGAALLDRLFGDAPTGAADGQPARLGRVSAADANRRGLDAFRRGRFATATEQFREAHRAAPGVAEYHNNYAWALFKHRQYRRAALELERVVSRHPDRWLARENLAAAYLAAGDTASAVQALERLVAHAPPPDRRLQAERLLARLRGLTDGFVPAGAVVHAEAHPAPPAEAPAPPVDSAPPAGAIAVDTVPAASPAPAPPA